MGEFLRRIQYLLNRRRLDAELQNDMEFHREMAQRAGNKNFGNTLRLREQAYEAWGWTWLDRLIQDLRYGIRMLAKSPAYTAIITLTLALAIGANTAIFSLINAVMLRSLPVRDPQQLVMPQWSALHDGNDLIAPSFGDCNSGSRGATAVTGCSLSYPFFQQIQQQNNLFSSTAAFAGTIPLNVSGNGAAVIAQGEIVSGNFFETMGVHAALGRLLDAEDDKPGAPAAAVLTYAWWQRAFDSSPSVIGRAIRLNNVAVTIVGVAEPGFTRLTPGKAVDVWVPIHQGSALQQPWLTTTDPNFWWVVVVGRLQPGVSRQQAQSVLNTLFFNASVHGAKPVWTAKDSPRLALLPAQQGLTGIREMFGAPLKLLMAAVGLVLLIACANVAGLTLARSAAREREIVVRLAIGAARRPVIRQLLTESLLLSFLGASVGAVLAWVGATGLAAAFSSANSWRPLQIDLHLDLRVFFFTLGTALFTGIAFGLAPAFRGSRSNVTAQLKGNTTTVASTRGRGRRFGLGNGLVVLQVAISMVVLAGAGLLLRTIDKLHSIDPGFNTHNLILFNIDPGLAGYKDEQLPDLYSNIRTRIAALPGVVDVGYSAVALLTGGVVQGDVNPEGSADKSHTPVQILFVGPNFFTTMKIPLLEGRQLTEADAKGPKHAMVNRAFVQKFLSGRNPIGVHLGDGNSKPGTEIVGVVGDTRYANLRRVNAPIVFYPMGPSGATFEVRTAVSPATLMPAVRSTVNSIDANVPVVHLRTQMDSIDMLLFSELLLARLFGLFGALGLLLACIGLYGLLSYEVERRTREIGIRTALGAQRSTIWSMVVRQGIVLVIIGTLAGCGAAFGVTRLLASLLYDVRPADPLTFGLTGGLLLLVGVLACSLPARRATRVDPMAALRCE
jgi:predicted permease